MKTNSILVLIVILCFLNDCTSNDGPINNDDETNEESVKQEETINLADSSTWSSYVEKHLEEADKLTDVFIAIAVTKGLPQFEETDKTLTENINKYKAEFTKLIEDKDKMPAEKFNSRETELKKLLDESIKALEENSIKWKDEKQKLLYKRSHVIKLLAKLGTKKAIRFLIDNITLDLGPRKCFGDVEMAMGMICLVVLIEKSDWRVIPYVLKALEKPRTEQEIRYYWLVLNDIMDENSGVKKLGHKRTRALIQSEIDTFKDDKDKATYINNLNQIKQYLEKPEK